MLNGTIFIYFHFWKYMNIIPFLEIFMKEKYIFMADIIESRKKDDLVVMWQLKELVHDMNKTFFNAIDSPITITLGDEFQGIIENFESLIRIIFFIEEECIKKGYIFKLRYVISESDLHHINYYSSYGMISPKLISAREMLNESKKNSSRFNFNLEKMDCLKQKKLNLLFSCYQAKIDSFPIKDHMIIEQYLSNNRRYSEIASILKMYESTVWKKMKRLDIDTYINLKTLIELEFLNSDDDNVYSYK